MNDKIRVRDLATELNQPVKELLSVLKELNIPAKNGTYILADEEIARLKERLNPGQASEKRKGADVVVRRRKEAAPESAPPSAEDKEAAGDDDKPAEASPVKSRKGAAPQIAARVLSRPPDEAPPARETPTGPEPKAAARAAHPAERRTHQPNLSAEPETDAHGLPLSSQPHFAGHGDGDSSGQPLDAAEKERAGAPGRGGVRIISRPLAAEPPDRRRDSRGGPRPDRPGRPPAGDRPGGGRDDRSARPDAARPVGRKPLPGKPAGDNRAPGRLPGALPATGFTPPQENSEARNKKRGKGKRTVDFAEDRRSKGADEESWLKSARRTKNRKGKPEAKISTSQPIKAAKRKIRMEEFVRVADLAHQMGLKAGEIIKVLFNLGVMATINQSLDFDTTVLVAAEFSYEVERVGFMEDEFLTAKDDDRPETLQTRPPVVTIMGHVDHGKTSLLDAIRQTSVTSGEAGGITQHIGAYHVHTPKGDIVFLDTPGHEAFTAMRARGAKVTDIVVLVVAADDGVMEQTREAINHSRAAKVPIMVAVNKMDKPEANPDRVKRELADLGMMAEEWGGDTTFSHVSAKTKDGLDEFLELLALQAEILELKANPAKAARGHIVEAKLDKGRGALGTVLIQQGTLHVGDAFVCGIHHGRVRALFNDQGIKVESAGPSMPVEVQGFEGVPQAGDEFVCLADEKTARRIAETRAMKQRERELAKESKVTLETFLSQRAGAAETLVLNLVLKADVQGSLEAIQDQLKKLSTDKVRIHVVHSGAGTISESDILLAAASEAIIIGFNVRPNPKTKELAEQEKIDIRFYDIIYKLVEEIKRAMEGLLSPLEKEVFGGSAEVRETFNVSKAGVIAGCMVTDGKIQRSSRARLLRDGVVVYTGRIASLRRFKDDAREVLKGYECGISIENFNDLKVGDIIEAFEIVEEAARL
ncbi:MAG: translation initiation factor IF-2 [Desulfovibrionaceae bacterium]|nr:translation initiation factor IF-2 [Desulfovibrionaceae bacterium]